VHISSRFTLSRAHEQHLSKNLYKNRSFWKVRPPVPSDCIGGVASEGRLANAGDRWEEVAGKGPRDEVGIIIVG
jgi:hypothetical protein